MKYLLFISVINMPEMKLPLTKKIRYAAASLLSKFLDRVLGNIINYQNKRCYVIVSPYIFEKYGKILICDNDGRAIRGFERTPSGFIKIEWEYEK